MVRPDFDAEDRWVRLTELIAQRTGLHFPPERRGDLERAVLEACRELKVKDLETCVDWLLASPLNSPRMQVLASHLTIGETYFFREKKTFEALADTILPELIRTRQANGQFLRIWSAACCSGEEPYSIAIQLQQTLPRSRDWQITLLATDINHRFLEKAAAGIYNEWSFRGNDDRFREAYFERMPDGKYALDSEIRKMVTFAPLNLVEDSFPSLATGVNAFDVIFCRNVLMYFTPAQAKKVVDHLHRSLVPGGWLVTSPSEGSHVMFSEFAPVNRPGVILYRRKDPSETDFAYVHAGPGDEQETSRSASGPEAPDGSVRPSQADLGEVRAATTLAVAQGFYDQGQYVDAVEVLMSLPEAAGIPGHEVSALLTRSLANQGKLAEALLWCGRWLAAEKFSASGHYLKAVILQELGDYEQARSALRTAIYLKPDFVMAHFALGNLVQEDGQTPEAQRSFVTAAGLARSLAAETLLPESDGLTAGRLAEIIASIRTMEASP